MDDAFVTWVNERIGALRKELIRLEGVIEVQKEYEAAKYKTEDFLSELGETPTEAIKRLMNTSPDIVFSTDDLKIKLDSLRDSGILHTKGDRSTRNLVHSSMNWLVKSGFATKLEPTQEGGPSQYRKAN